jgi:hypothetical protein
VRLEREAKAKRHLEEACNSSFAGLLAHCFSSCEIAFDTRFADAVKKRFDQQFPRTTSDAHLFGFRAGAGEWVDSPLLWLIGTSIDRLCVLIAS